MSVVEKKYQEQVEEVQLTPQELQAVQERIKGMRELTKDKTPRAKYKIEIRFFRKRTSRAATPGFMSWWLSGKKLHGGGDEKMYVCPNCNSFILEDGNVSSVHYCHGCGQSYEAEKAIGEIYFNLTMQKWAEVINMWFHKLGGDCDIYLKHSPDDIRAHCEREMLRKAGGDVLNKMRSARGLYIYPLANIIKDLGAGADPVKRFKAFLTA